MYLVLVVRTGYAHRVPHICCICAEQIIIIFIILPCNLPGSLATKVCVSSLTYAMSPQHFLRRRIYRIAFSAPDLLSAGGRRSYIKFICYAEFFYHVLEDELRDGGTADVTMADEEYFYHCFISPCFAPECPVLRRISGICKICVFTSILAK